VGKYSLSKKFDLLPKDFTSSLLLTIAFLFPILKLYPYLQSCCPDDLWLNWTTGAIFKSNLLEFHGRYFAHIFHLFLFKLFGINFVAATIFGVFIHYLNVFLVHRLALMLGLSRLAALFAAVLFCTHPGIIASFRVDYLLELTLMTSFLGVTIGYLGRIQAKKPWAWRGWLFLEALSVYCGTGSKESFLIYPMMLVAVELFLTRQADRAFWDRVKSIGKNLLPQLPLIIYAIYIGLPQVTGHNEPSHALSFSISHLLIRLDFVISHMGGPLFSDEWHPTFLGLGLFILLVILSVFKWRSLPQLPFAFLWMLTTLLPVLPFLTRMENAYIYHPWAGLSLVLGSIFFLLFRTKYGKLAAILMVCLYTYGNLLDIRKSKFGDCGFLDQAIYEIGASPKRLCHISPPIWKIHPELWHPICKRSPLCRKEMNSFIGKEVNLALEKTSEHPVGILQEIVRLHCRNPAISIKPIALRTPSRPMNKPKPMRIRDFKR